MSEIVEIIEEHGHEGGGHESNPWMLPVTVTLSIMAVLVAIVTLLGHRTNTEQIILQTQASDQWAYFQAKNIRAHEMQSVADMLGAFTVADHEKADALKEKYLKDAERYEKEKEEISEKAKELEAERKLIGAKADRFEGGEVLLEIGLVICSFTLLTKKKFFWFAGMLLGIAGIAVVLSGYLMH